MTDTLYDARSVFLLNSINCITEEFSHCLARYQEHLNFLHRLPAPGFEKALVIADVQNDISLEQTIYEERVTTYMEILNKATLTNSLI